jgi:hypothetical protein
MPLFEIQTILQNYASFLTPHVKLVTVLNDHLLIVTKVATRFTDYNSSVASMMLRIYCGYSKNQILIDPMDADFQ